MKKLLLILLCLPMIGFGQGWETTFGGTGHARGQSVQQTTDGGYVITGFIKVFGNGDHDVYLIKTDGNGDSLWTKTFGGTGDDIGRSVQQTIDGGYVITGQKDAYTSNSAVYLIKTDGNGIEQWSQTFGGTDGALGSSVQQTTDGGYIITGGKAYTSNVAVYLLKTDGNGVEQWSQIFVGTGDAEGYSVQQTIDGGYIITGYTPSFGNGNSDVYLLKTDGNGIEQWSQTFGGTDDDMGWSVQQTTDGGYIITGMNSFDGSLSDIYLIKTDGSGVEQWNKIFGGTGFSAGLSVQQTTDGGYIIAGSGGHPSEEAVYILKTDGNGIEQWSKVFGTLSSEEMAFSVQQTTDGGYIITGNKEDNLYLIKTDGNGNITSTFNIPINPNRKLQKVVDILGRETKPQTNTPLIEIYDDGTVEKRIVIE